MYILHCIIKHVNIVVITRNTLSLFNYHLCQLSAIGSRWRPSAAEAIKKERERQEGVKVLELTSGQVQSSISLCLQLYAEMETILKKLASPWE